MSTRAEGCTVHVTVTARAIFTAGKTNLTLTVREEHTADTWRYNLADGTQYRAANGSVAGMADHMDVLRYAASLCASGYAPGTVPRGLLEQFATGRDRPR